MLIKSIKREFKRLSNSQKGVMDIADFMIAATGILIFYIAMQLFYPFTDLLANTMADKTNGATVMAITYLIPVVLIGLFLYMLVKKAQSPQF